HRIVVNRAIDYSRARALRRESGDTGLDTVAAATRPDNPHARSLAAALAELSPEHRAVIVLRHLLDYTPGEIAELTGLPRGTVNSRLRRGLDHLATRLGEDVRCHAGGSPHPASRKRVIAAGTSSAAPTRSVCRRHAHATGA